MEFLPNPRYKDIILDIPFWQFKNNKPSNHTEMLKSGCAKTTTSDDPSVKHCVQGVLFFACKKSESDASMTCSVYAIRKLRQKMKILSWGKVFKAK